PARSGSWTVSATRVNRSRTVSVPVWSEYEATETLPRTQVATATWELVVAELGDAFRTASWKIVPATTSLARFAESALRDVVNSNSEGCFPGWLGPSGSSTLQLNECNGIVG